MPLNILKRTSKQYNVVSKSMFVISVTLLDNGIMECTLDADSTGNDCLYNISQRLGLHQPEFFGLRYISRGVPPRQRWIELEQPLKKQLEKYAEDSQLSLGVMFYVTDVNNLRDEMARYHYFLQLKSDVIDGKLNCSIDQAISLAAYSLQAEFGDYDPERHTIEYLRDFAILPKDLTSEDKFHDFNVEALFDAVARQYNSLIGFPPPLAEIYYIMVAQQLDGYGQECYPAKDDSGNDILICVSVNGLVIRRRDWTHVAAFRWADIKSLMGHKKTFILESAQSQRTMQFHFSDPEVVKYVRKICLLQNTFQKDSVKGEQQNGDISQRNSAVNYVSHSSNPADSFDSPSSYGSSNVNLRATPDLIAPSYGIGSQYSLNNNFAHQASTINNTASSPGLNMHLFHNNSLPSSKYHNQLLQQRAKQLHDIRQEQPLHRSLQELSDSNPSLQYGRPVTPRSGNMVTMPDLGASAPMTHHSMNMNPNGTDSDVQSLLPSYRPAPDYDTAVQLKYGQHRRNMLPNVEQNSVREKPSKQQSYTEDEEPIYQNEIVSKMHSIELHSRESQMHQDRGENTALMKQSKPKQLQVSCEPSASKLYMYKPPPPYPGTSHAQIFEPLHQQSKVAIGGAVLNAQPNANAHLETLNQISSDLNSSDSALSQSNANNYAPHCSGSTSIGGSCSNVVRTKNDTSGAASIINELKKSMPSNVANKFLNAEDKEIREVLASKEIPRAATDLPIFRRPIDPVIMKEFQGIQKAKGNPDFSTAMKRENVKRNRTPNILPYEDNSIRVSSSRQNPTGYINASPVCATIGDRMWKYIVGQIPLSGSGSSSLWQMIWETESKIIVSLERDSSAQFYPSGSTSTSTHGDFQITDCKKRLSNTKASIARELLVTFLPKKKQRRVWILPYEEEWKDDVPIDTEHFLCFLEEVNSVQRKVSEDVSPLTVLCGTGAGRSGVFILSDLLLHAADAGHKIRCDKLLSELRTERMLLVTHPPQYAFVLDTLAKYLAQSRLI